MNKKHQNIIETFVRNTLGCTCPDEIFDRIDLQSSIPELSGDIRSLRLVLGNRLLVYLVAGLSNIVSSETLSPLVSCGVRDRDAHQLNRFRLVLLVPEDFEPMGIQLSFQSMSMVDERVHLHFVPNHDIREPLRP
ncbi:MAG: hypothetical protein D6B25_09300 [Desulfobulbaceae bacterium]|nr:MAG: hypothetical protein D6B25_09300 [Desulfobulbaceae bacterium]